MSFIFSGSLCGYLCKDCREPISGAIIRLYRPDPKHQATGASQREQYEPLSEEQVAAQKNRLLAETRADEAGKFSFELDPQKVKYQGGPLQIDVRLEDVPNRKPTRREPKPVQFTLGTMTPRWRETQDGTLVGRFEHCLSAKIWCYLRGLFDAWVICGRVRNQEDGQPLANLRVVAFDDDWITDDKLGTGLTNNEGYFRIDYTSRDFRQTFLSPLINTETPPPFNSGPDLYFRVETNGTPETTTVLYEEPPSRGREPGRENSGPCFCIEFRVDLPGDGNTGYAPALFTHVGSYSILSDFDANGLTNDSQNNAFTNVVPLIGNLPGGNASNAMEYRFRLFRLDGGVSELSPAEVTALISPTRIGTLLRLMPHDPGVPTSIPGIGYYLWEPFFLNHPSATHNVTPDANGWIEVPRMNDLTAGGTGQFQASGPSIALARIDTRDLFQQNFDLTSPTVHVAGNPIAAADKYAPANPPRFRIVFEAREVGAASLSATNILPRMAVWNGVFRLRRHPSWNLQEGNFGSVCMLEIDELIGVGCGNVSSSITARYSAYHPVIDTVQGWIKGPGGNFGHFNPTPDGTGEASGTQSISLSGQPDCAYILKLRTTFRLTAGYGRISGAHTDDEIAFCKG